MKTVTKWECYESAKKRIDAAPKKKVEVKKKKKSKKKTKERASGLNQKYLTICGGIRPLPILLPNDEEE